MVQLRGISALDLASQRRALAIRNRRDLTGRRTTSGLEPVDRNRIEVAGSTNVGPDLTMVESSFQNHIAAGAFLKYHTIANVTKDIEKP